MDGFDARRLARREVLGLPVYSPGRSPEEVAREFGIADCVKMASNENPLGPSPLALKAAAAELERVNVYPDGDSRLLRAALAARLGLGEEQVLVTHGADEALDLIAYAFLEPGDRVVLADPTFSSYELAALTMGAAIDRVPLKDYRQDLPAMLERVGPRTKAVFVCSPLNPTGTAVTEKEWRALLADWPGNVLLVLDEAYVDFVDEEAGWDSLPYLEENPWLVITRTFSKAYGLAGLRVGYAACSPQVREMLEKVKLPFNVNRVGQAAALAALDDEEHLKRSREANQRGKQRLYRLLEECGFEYVPTQANFILVRNGDRPDLWEGLLRRGVIVRAGEALGLPGHVRITIGDDAQNDRLEAALRDLAEAGEAGGGA
jgi:histidinol-phosphate aminotransferase